MGLNCETCGFIAISREQFAGHRSGHARRQEIPKQNKIRETDCKICGQQFATRRELGGHSSVHRIPFENLRCDGTRKKRLINERGYKCEICKNSKWMEKPIPLSIDHIDGNTDNCLRENLRLLCANCHAQTPTFAEKNVGNFPLAKRRAYRARYYISKTSINNSTEECLSSKQKVEGSNPF